jgi:RimJ/RimL family protein N-acetyltransferase
MDPCGDAARGAADCARERRAGRSFRDAVEARRLRLRRGGAQVRAGASSAWSACSGFPVPEPLGPCVEIGWRLAREHWGQGYATEAARAWLAHGFEVLELAEIVAFTDAGNARSLAVMARLGMRARPGAGLRASGISEGSADAGACDRARAGGRRVIATERLILRPWAERDREVFAAMNADPAVMAHFPEGAGPLRKAMRCFPD